MKFDIGAVFAQLVSLYARLPLAQKIALPLLMGASVMLVVFVSRWATKPDYAVLFSGLEEGDAAGIVERLKDQKIGYRLRDDGRTVEVSPPELVHELRLEMAAGGLPKGKSVGFEVLSDGALGRTGFVEMLNYMRGLQGELERTIQSINAVKSVRVHITNPKRSVFVKRDVLPTASVLLKLKAGEELTPRQVKGIANLVANSVERLTSDNVTILDSFGNILNEKREGEDLSEMDSTKLELKRKLELELQRRVETMLGEILGQGRAVARINTEMDFSKYQKEEESYDPAGQVVRSTRLVEENAGLTAEGGVPGVISNLTNDPGLLTPPDSSENANLRKERVTNFEISRAISKTISASGNIKKLSVAVLVDGIRENASSSAAAAGGEVKQAIIPAYKPLAPEMLKKIENLVKQAVGYDATRGDIVTVENIPFFEPEETLAEAIKTAEEDQKYEKYIGWILPGLGIILLFLILYPMMRFLISPTEAEVDLSRLLPAGIEELEAELEAERKTLASLPSEAQVPTVDIQELEGLLSENSRMVKDNPRQAALLIRYWLNEGGL
ncbi:MAG: flagellar M-ring protein FliF [Deltaproteobacteria bacterium]|nr:flagellar M-ring protein FliF [Deltaproteobacteria bacterium]